MLSYPGVEVIDMNGPVDVCLKTKGALSGRKDRSFVRVHNKHLVNRIHIEKYQRGRGGIVQMSDKKEVAVARRKKEEFLKLISINGGKHKPDAGACLTAIVTGAAGCSGAC